MSHKKHKNSKKTKNDRINTDYYNDNCDNYKKEKCNNIYENHNLNSDKNNKDNNINDDKNIDDILDEFFDEQEISDDDMEALKLLNLQLKGILLDFCGDSLLWNSTVQGIQYILEKYDGIDGNEHTSTLIPDETALQSSYVFLAAKILSMIIAFTRYNIVSKKKAEGTFKYSLQPNIDINIANVLNLAASYYFIRGAQGIVMRGNNQPVFGI